MLTTRQCYEKEGSLWSPLFRLFISELKIQMMTYLRRHTDGMINLTKNLQFYNYFEKRNPKNQDNRATVYLLQRFWTKLPANYIHKYEISTKIESATDRLKKLTHI